MNALHVDSVQKSATARGTRRKASAQKRAGTQSIERAASILREVALRGRSGWSLSELAEHCRLDKTTTHRIVACLKRERLLQQNPGDRHYLPGPLLFELGISVPHYRNFIERSQRSLTRISREVMGVTSLIVRSGYEGVFAAQGGQGRYPAFAQVGKRAPLASLVGGVAILLTLSDEEARHVIAHNFKQIAQVGDERIPGYERLIERSRNAGFAITQGESYRGLNAVAVPVVPRFGPALGALSAGGAQAEFPLSRLRDIRNLLQEEADAIARDTTLYMQSNGVYADALEGNGRDLY